MIQRTDAEWATFWEEHSTNSHPSWASYADFGIVSRDIRAELIAEFKAWLMAQIKPIQLDFVANELECYANQVDEVFKP